jgi:hypothetical protein
MWMNCDRKDNKTENKEKDIPTGSGEFKSDKPLEKDGGRQSKIFRLHKEGTVNEAGTSDRL